MFASGKLFRRLFGDSLSQILSFCAGHSTVVSDPLQKLRRNSQMQVGEMEMETEQIFREEIVSTQSFPPSAALAATFYVLQRKNRIEPGKRKKGSPLFFVSPRP